MGSLKEPLMKDQVKDPVCGMMVDRTTPRKRTLHGREYHFCSDACMTRFQENPAAFIAE